MTETSQDEQISAVVLAALKAAEQPLTPKQIHERTGWVDYDGIKQVCRRLLRKGLIEQPAHGVYTLPGREVGTTRGEYAAGGGPIDMNNYEQPAQPPGLNEVARPVWLNIRSGGRVFARIRLLFEVGEPVDLDLDPEIGNGLSP